MDSESLRRLLHDENPFDELFARSFVESQDRLDFNVPSIHRRTMKTFSDLLAQVSERRATQTLLLLGDGGAGKTHLLGRLAREHAAGGTFVYVEPYPSRSRLWSHVLRQTVNGLLRSEPASSAGDGRDAPARRLRLGAWLSQGRLFSGAPTNPAAGPAGAPGGAAAFVAWARSCAFPDLYEEKSFFSALYHLFQPATFGLAREWLRGDGMDAEDLRAIGALRTEEDDDRREDHARSLLLNLCRISEGCSPLVLCFDQLDNIERAEDGTIDLQPLLDVNTALHAKPFPNLLVVFSVVEDTFRRVSRRVQQADLVRVGRIEVLEPIGLDEGRELIARRLAPLHRAAGVPDAPDRPTNVEPVPLPELEALFAARKTCYPREVLDLARREIDRLLGRSLPPPLSVRSATAGERAPQAEARDAQRASEELLLAFRGKWATALTAAQREPGDFGPEEHAALLHEILLVLGHKPSGPFLPAKLAPFSLATSSPDGTVGFVWHERVDGNEFDRLMKACQEAAEQPGLRLILLRRALPPASWKAGNKRFAELFQSGGRHRWTASAQPLGTSSVPLVQVLEAWRGLVHAAVAGELHFSGNALDAPALVELARRSNLLRELGLSEALHLPPPDGLTIAPAPAPRPSPQFAPAAETAATPAEVHLLAQFDDLAYILEERLVNDLRLARRELGLAEARGVVSGLVARGALAWLHPGAPEPLRVLKRLG